MADAVCCEVIAPSDWTPLDDEITTADDAAFCDGGGALPGDVEQFGA